MELGCRPTRICRTTSVGKRRTASASGARCLDAAEVEEHARRPRQRLFVIRHFLVERDRDPHGVRKHRAVDARQSGARRRCRRHGFGGRLRRGGNCRRNGRFRRRWRCDGNGRARGVEANQSRRRSLRQGTRGIFGADAPIEPNRRRKILRLPQALVEHVGESGGIEERVVGVPTDGIPTDQRFVRRDDRAGLARHLRRWCRLGDELQAKRGLTSLRGFVARTRGLCRGRGGDGKNAADERGDHEG